MCRGAPEISDCSSLLIPSCWASVECLWSICGVFGWFLFLVRSFIFGVCVCVCVTWCTCGGQRTTYKNQFSPPPCGSQELNSSCRAWWQAPLSTEPSHERLCSIFLVCLCFVVDVCAFFTYLHIFTQDAEPSADTWSTNISSILHAALHSFGSAWWRTCFSCRWIPAYLLSQSCLGMY